MKLFGYNPLAMDRARELEISEGFANIDHIHKIKTILLPKVENFADTLQNFMNDNDEVRQCIIKFDSSISMKANKA